MKPTVLLAVCFALAIGLFAFTSETTAADSSNLPPGSYKETCKDIELTDSGMHARCKSESGTWRKTFIPASEMSCPNGIENLDGELVCPRG